MIEVQIGQLLGKKAFESAIIDVSQINFSADVVAACAANHCGCFGTRWFCPPAVGQIDDLRKKYSQYKKAYVFTTKSKLEDSFDLEGMDKARVAHQKLTRKILPLRQSLQIEVLGAGACDLCKKCTYPNAKCAHLTKAFAAVEAVGIDVVSLAATSGIRYHNGANTVTYFSVIFFND